MYRRCETVPSVGLGSECEASDHTGGWAVEGDLTGKKRQTKPTGDAGARATGASQRQRGVRTRDARWWWEPQDGPERARDKARNNKRRGKITRRNTVLGTSLEGTNGPYNSTRRGWKHQVEGQSKSQNGLARM